MAAYDLEEQEQLAEIKAWWRQHGNLVTGIITAVALGVAAWQVWNWYQARQAAEASVIYSSLQRAALEKDAQKVKTSAGELIEKYSGTAYAPLGALTAAKSMFDAGDLKNARQQLQWVAEHGSDELGDLGRLRLAAVLLDDGAYDEALQALAKNRQPAFAARFAELRGDVLAAQGKDAADAYRAALAALDKAAASGANTLQSGEMSAQYRAMLQLKLDASGGAK